MSEADGLIEVAEERTEVREGDPVPFLGFAELGLEAAEPPPNVGRDGPRALC